MPGAGDRAYVYAKACGILGKSFVGKRISELRDINRLAELDRLVFPQTNQDLPGRELLVNLEDRIISRSAAQITRIVDSFSRPPELLIRLLRTYEYSDLKTALGSLADGETHSPGFTDIGRFRTVKFEAYPDLHGMLEGTEFAFLLHEEPGTDAQSDTIPAKNAGNIHIQTTLDCHYYASLWKALLALPKIHRITLEKLLSEEISLRNTVWALRLRTYYEMSGDEIQDKLIFIETKKGVPSFLTAPALASLSLSLDNREEWKHWKWARLLNPETSLGHWKVDPRYVQNAASQYLYRHARSAFRQRPLSLDAIFCFIKLKQFEEDLLTSLAEGLGMGMSSQDILTLLEVNP